MLVHVRDALLKLGPPALLLSIFVRALFEAYWAIAAKASAPNESSEPDRSRKVHVFLVNLAVVLLYAPIPGLRQRVLPDALAVSGTGLAIQAASTLLAVWARRHLGSNWSGEITIKVDHRLVESGPYGSVRHPIYTAILGMSAGAAMVSGQLHAVFGLAVVSFAYWRKIRIEEANLRKAFGPAYDDYRRGTWTLVPWLL